MTTQIGRKPIVNPQTVYSIIRGYAMQHGGNSPTGSELHGLLVEAGHDIGSVQTVYGYLETLEKLGWIEIRDRKIVVVGVEVQYPEVI